MKNKMKKILISVCVLFLLVISSCASLNNGMVALPSLDGLSREEIGEKLSNLGLKYYFQYKHIYITSPLQYDKFVDYNGYDIGEYVKKGTEICVLTTELPLTYEIASTVSMPFVYENKNFLTDGVGEATLYRNIDGDTAHFSVNGEIVKVRFLGIDTPESTYDKEAWGKAASNFTASILSNAKTIVLENFELKKDVYGRNLAYVWADGVLVNLLLVQEAYSDSKIESDSPYFEYFMKAGVEARKTGRRVYGEIDPNYDYKNKVFK